MHTFKSALVLNLWGLTVIKTKMMGLKNEGRRSQSLVSLHIRRGKDIWGFGPRGLESLQTHFKQDAVLTFLFKSLIQFEISLSCIFRGSAKEPGEARSGSGRRTSTGSRTTSLESGETRPSVKVLQSQFCTVCSFILCIRIIRTRQETEPTHL